MEIRADKTGKWLNTGRLVEWYTQEFICSLCGRYMLGQYKYCPHCGARMLVDKEWLSNGSKEL